MGLCFSRKKSRRSQPSKSTESCRDPPPEAEEPPEETVKEVLSETPRLKTPRPSKEEDPGIGRDDRSEETSEVCSISEGFSVSTSVTEVAAEDRPVSASPAKFQRKRSSSSGDIAVKRERMAGYVAAVGCRSGRSSPSPTRRREGGGGGGGRMCLVRDASKSRGNALCRDVGERSGRRSVSSVAKQSTMRVNGRSSPLRVAGGGAGEGRRFGGGGKTTMPKDMVEIGGKESLENPLVSLECFIFL